VCGCRGWDGHQWAEPDPIHLSELMWEVHDNAAAADRKGLLARSTMVDKYSFNTMGSELLQHLDRIHEIMSGSSNMQMNEL
jgi:hypothetical protein